MAAASAGKKTITRSSPGLVGIRLSVVFMTAAMFFVGGSQDVRAQTAMSVWSGGLTWSMNAQTPGGSWTKFSGNAKLKVNDDGRGNLTGAIEGKVFMDGEDRETGLCPSITTATPSVGKARLTGTLARGATVMKLEAVGVEAVAQGYTTPCFGTALPIPPADFVALLHTATLQQRPDKTYHAGGMTQKAQDGSTITNEFSLTLRRSEIVPRG
ncbi:MAG: hypothetical protein M9939_22360 [Mesorhizobium sp.]|nr:hypothetical protein [Mesorhizobium sp.]MCO5163876.1 hypothetical protein [Mesorhizobium sp.]